jgi:site-specific DNA-methyltransferase (adenine-specific)
MIVESDAIAWLSSLEPASVDLCWTDPPFNTGDTQKIISTGLKYDDKHLAYADMMERTARGIHRALKPSGMLCMCLDYREVHNIKVMLDGIFGRDNFRGEIIWNFELGSIAKKFWTNKHNTILLYSKTDNFIFNFDEVPTMVRKSPGKGYNDLTKKVASVWNFTMSNTDPQRVGYPNQKPVEIIEPFIRVHTTEGAVVIDPFAGGGSVGEAAKRTGRKYMLCDCNPEACQVMKERLHD